MSADKLFKDAIAYIQSPDHFKSLARVIINELTAIEGFEDLPDPLRQAIEQYAATLYGYGFVKGAQWHKRRVD